MSAVSFDAREQLRGFVVYVLEQLAPELASGRSAAPIRGTNSSRGLCEAARDVVEWCVDLQPERIELIDHHPAGVGLPTLTQMRDRRYQAMLEVLASGRILGASKARLVSSYLTDADSSLSAEAKAAAVALLAQFEASR